MYGKIVIALAMLFALIAIYFDPSIFHPLVQVFVPSKIHFQTSEKLFKADELKIYNGIKKPELYLAILGKVFDVSQGAKHYGPGCSYNFFIGRDSSRSFVTGQFAEDHASDQVADLNPDELRSLNHWVQFYLKSYNRVGKLIGRYYDENGKLTRYGREVKNLIKAAELKKESEDLEKIKYPPCNVEWDADKGSRVWCTNKSGGISRDWIGVPRQLYEPGSTNYRCACVKSGELTGNMKQYDGCDSAAETCYVKE